MGGRIHGFLGGVLLTSAFAYYTGEYFKKNSTFISHQLQISDNVINNRILTNKDLLKELEPKSSHISTTDRVNFSETSKHIWNDEIITMVNWVYSINWYQWGLTVDKKFNQLLDKVAFSGVEKK
ncbi:uncharacterized protein RJT21DRAFT_119125 [Scheffersomyces amazonensis]|uniref:uncharacterized protein n=1 Tax=Scheffersomyces amazonensis TaxID=1078765 RepID=UPI00315CD47F